MKRQTRRKATTPHPFRPRWPSQFTLHPNTSPNCCSAPPGTVAKPRASRAGVGHRKFPLRAKRHGRAESAAACRGTALAVSQSRHAGPRGASSKPDAWASSNPVQSHCLGGPQNVASTFCQSATQPAQSGRHRRGRVGLLKQAATHAAAGSCMVMPEIQTRTRRLTLPRRKELPTT